MEESLENKTERIFFAFSREIRYDKIKFPPDDPDISIPETAGGTGIGFPPGDDELKRGARGIAAQSGGVISGFRFRKKQGRNSLR